MNCSAFGCTNCKKKNPELSFFKLPSDPVIAGIWRRNSRISDKFKQVRLCSEHFEEKYFDYSHYLKIRLLQSSKFLVKHKLIPGAIPTIFTRNNKDETLKVDYNNTEASLSTSVTKNDVMIDVNENCFPIVDIETQNISFSENSLSSNADDLFKEEATNSTVYIILSPAEFEDNKYEDRICPFYKNGRLCSERKSLNENKYVQTAISFNQQTFNKRKRDDDEIENEQAQKYKQIKMNEPSENDMSQSDTNFYWQK